MIILTRSLQEVRKRDPTGGNQLQAKWRIRDGDAGSGAKAEDTQDLAGPAKA